jgi:hypothetical protein
MRCKYITLPICDWFYDFSDPSVLKKRKNLKVVGEGMDGIVLMVVQLSGNTFRFKTVGTSTSYSLTLNSGNTNPALNVDNLKFDYATQNICFQSLWLQNYFYIRRNQSLHAYRWPSCRSKWIKFISVKNIIENENETHKIFFFLVFVFYCG